MSSCGTDSRFAVQRVSKEVWTAATIANLAADYQAGFVDVVDDFIASRGEREFAELGAFLRGAGADELAGFVAGARSRSLAFLVLMLTGACNADCPICFTDRRRRPGELPPAERDRLLREAHALGARFVYIPGEGEPTIDGGFLSLLQTCKEIGLHAVVFTNGLVFSDERACRRYLGLIPDEAVDMLAEYPVSFYHKMWSTKPELVAEMMQIQVGAYDFTRLDDVMVPAGLIRLMERWPRERVGIEVVVERRNAQEVVDVIVPFAERHGLARIVELIQHNGRVLGDSQFDPTTDQARAVRPLLSPTSCTMATCKAVITSRGFLAPRIAVLEHQIPGPPQDVRTGPLFDSLHRTPYIVNHRYQISACLCETLAARLAVRKGGSLPLFAPNIVPAGLEPEAGSLSA